MPVLSWLSVSFVRNLIEIGRYTIPELLEYLQNLYPAQSGLSLRNLKRFLQENDIHKHIPVTEEALDSAVASAAAQVGGTYGRKMMTGYLQSVGVVAGQRRVSYSLQRVAPYYHFQRSKGTQNQLNPQSYHAPHFGYNLHLDQNEKLVDYGVVFVLAVDGHSNLIVKGAVMPRKNNLTIYEEVFSAAINDYGMWDCIICDHGKEFFLTEFVQHYLSDHRIQESGSVSARPPYKQVASTKNNRIERIWGEVNPRVGFPLKWAFMDLEAKLLADASRGPDLFAMSQVGIAVAKVGLELYIASWNSHPLPRTGIPTNAAANRLTFALGPNDLPSCAAAVQMYESSGGHLTDPSPVGEDLLAGHVVLQTQRDSIIRQEIDASGGLGALFGEIVNGQYGRFHHTILSFISLTENVYSRNLLN